MCFWAGRWRKSRFADFHLDDADAFLGEMVLDHLHLGLRAIATTDPLCHLPHLPHDDGGLRTAVGVSRDEGDHGRPVVLEDLHLHGCLCFGNRHRLRPCGRGESHDREDENDSDEHRYLLLKVTLEYTYYTAYTVYCQVLSPFTKDGPRGTSGM